MLSDPLFVIAVLSLNVVLSEWLVRHTFFKHFGTALLVIVVTAVTANFGLIPTSSEATPVYGGVFTYVAPLAIFWLLLQVNLRDILRAGVPMLAAFLIGSVGTVIGVKVGMWLIDGPVSIGDQYRPLGAMYTGTYTGGSVNFNALALHFKVIERGVLYAGATAVDNIMTAVWMIATIALPRALLKVWPKHRRVVRSVESPTMITGVEDDTETVHPIDIGLVLAIGAAAVWLARHGAAWLAAHGLSIPSVLILTTVALILAQFRLINRLRGARLLGMFAVYLFLAVIGAYCDVAALAGMGALGTTLLVLVVITVGIHGLTTFTAGALLRLDPDVVAVASQANIGGSTSALALARSLGRPDLVVPAVLIGSLGYGIGTYLGLFAAAYLL